MWAMKFLFWLYIIPSALGAYVCFSKDFSYQPFWHWLGIFWVWFALMSFSIPFWIDRVPSLI